MAVPSMTVAVCTLDRGTLLSACLDAIVRQLADAPAVEVLVVDNGSTDDTAAIVGGIATARYVFEPRRGLSRARNTALRESSADLVAFLDDDARPVPGWVAAMLAASRCMPDAVAFGGPVELVWPAERPAWLDQGFERWYSGRDLGDELRALENDENPVGANFAVRRSAALDAGGFDIALGRVGRSLGSEEEVALLRRMRAGGEVVAWVPDARVQHVVDAERLSRSWLLRRAWAQGRSDDVAARLEGRALTARPARAAVAAVATRWPAAIRGLRAAPNRPAAIMRELVTRTRRLGQIAAHVRRDRRIEPPVGP